MKFFNKSDYKSFKERYQSITKYKSSHKEIFVLNDIGNKKLIKLLNKSEYNRNLF